MSYGVFLGASEPITHTVCAPGLVTQTLKGGADDAAMRSRSAARQTLRRLHVNDRQDRLGRQL